MGRDEKRRPVASRRAFEIAGATAVIGGAPIEGRGHFYPATVLTDVAPGSEILRQEIFGPVATMHVVGSDAEAVSVANGTPFGLEGYVFAGDSPNDSPMFGYFPNAVGVANVADFEGLLEYRPRWVTAARSGAGFVELARALLDARD